MDIQRVLKRRCQVGKKFRQSMSQGLSNEQCTPDHRNIEKQGQDNVPGTGAEDGAAAEEALWTEEEIRSLFEEKTAGEGSTVLSCAAVDDGA